VRATTAGLRSVASTSHFNTSLGGHHSGNYLFCQGKEGGEDDQIDNTTMLAQQIKHEMMESCASTPARLIHSTSATLKEESEGEGGEGHRNLLLSFGGAPFPSTGIVYGNSEI